MTDKQIIIDGVDISKCKHYDEVFNYCDQSYLGEGGLLKNTKNPKRCECSPNCYYKQLKRKEQECDKLYIQLKADEEYHKEEENTLRKIIKNKEERNIELYKENNKLKQTLTEIKEIAENVQSFVGRINIEDDVFEQMEQILQKISEMNHDL